MPGNSFLQFLYCEYNTFNPPTVATYGALLLAIQVFMLKVRLASQYTRLKKLTVIYFLVFEPHLILDQFPGYIW